MRHVASSTSARAILWRPPLGAARLGRAGVLAVLTCLTAGCATAPPASRIALPLVERLQVQAIRIEPVSIEGASDAEQAWLRDLVSNVATTAARRTAVEQALAIDLVETVDPRSGEATYRLSGELRLPLALPEGTRGSWAAFREGELAHAHLELVGPDGRVVAQSDVELDWDDVRWTTGGPKLRRARRPEAALVDAAEKAIAVAVRDVAWRMEERRRSSTGAGDTAVLSAVVP